jgi:hypothetical protein
VEPFYVGKKKICQHPASLFNDQHAMSFKPQKSRSYKFILLAVTPSGCTELAGEKKKRKIPTEYDDVYETVLFTLFSQGTMHGAHFH